MHPATALATVLVDELVRCGLTDAVLAPGSRSAPLAYALHAEPRVRLHVRLDERSAGYLALGVGKGSGQPAAVVVTSGTAAANLHPAVLEAAHAGVGLLVLTADRPPELRATGANQTVDQVKLYGDAVRWFCEVGVPEARPGTVAYWRSLACRAWGRAAGTDSGPVHLNLAFREPLTPDDDAPGWPESLDGRAGRRPWTSVTDGLAAQAPPAPPALPDMPRAARGVLVAGEGTYDPEPFLALARERGWPVLAEPTSGARCGPNAVSAYHHLLASPGFAAAHRPELAVTLGKPGLSRPLLAMLETVDEHVVVDVTSSWPDPTRSATRVVAPPAESGCGRDERAGAVGGTRPGTDERETDWLSSWLSADRVACRALDEVLDSDEALTEPGLARDLAATIPEGSLLFAGSSMPIRDLDRMMRPRSGIRVVGNRGTSGIDGSVSTAAGAAVASSGPAYALLGDLGLIHDQNGLLPGAGEPHPDLTIVVVNNGGGGIFSLLPQSAHTDSFERLFGTPHGVSAQRVAATAGLPYALLEHPGKLRDRLAGRGTRIVEVRTDRAAGAAIRHRLQEAVDRALAYQRFIARVSGAS